MKYCKELLNLIYTLLKNNDNQTVNFLCEKDGIQIVAYLFEKVSKNSILPLEIIKLQFKILEHAYFVGNFKLIYLIMKHWIFNISIFTKFEEDTLKLILENSVDFMYRLEKINYNDFYDIFIQTTELLKNFSINTILNPEIKNLFSTFIFGLIVVLENNRQKENSNIVNNLFEIMQNLHSDNKSIEDFLKILVFYQIKFPWGHNNLLEYHIKNTALINKFSIIDFLLCVLKSEKISEISNSLFILLSFNWDDIFIPKTPAKHALPDTLVKIFPSFDPQDFVKNDSENKPNSIINLLNPIKYRGFNKTAEILLNLLFGYQKVCKFDEKIYYAILSYCINMPRIYISENYDKISVKLKEIEFLPSVFNPIYSQILKNFIKFNENTQKLIIQDLSELMKNKNFIENFLESDLVFNIIKNEILNPFAKTENSDKIHEIYELMLISFLKGNWNNKQKRDLNRITFFELSNKNPVFYITIYNKLFDQILMDPLNYAADEGIYSLIQFINSMEDLAISQNSAVFSNPKFIILIAKIVIFSYEIRMLYFWFPAFKINKFEKDNIIDYSESCFQREGGIIRILLRIIFGYLILLKTNPKNKLVIKILKFILFGQKKTLLKIIELCELNIKLLSLFELEPEAVENINFFNFSMIIFSKESLTIQHNCKQIINDKSIAQHILVSELLENSCYESEDFKQLFIMTNLLQAIIYRALNIASYSELNSASSSGFYKYESDNFLMDLLKLLGKIFTLKNEDETHTILLQVIQDSEKSYDYLAKIHISKCVTDTEFLPFKSLEIMRPNIESLIINRNSMKNEKLSVSVSEYNKLKIINAIKLEPSAISGSVNIQKNEKIPIKSAAGAKFVGKFFIFCDTIISAFKKYKTKEIEPKEYLSELVSQIISKEFLHSVQPVLHELVTEPYVLIDKMIRNNMIKSKKNIELSKNQMIKLDNEKDAIIEKIKSDISIIANNFQYAKNINILNETISNSNNKGKLRYLFIKEKILNEPIFANNNKNLLKQKEIYLLVSKYYAKLLKRCPRFLKMSDPKQESGIISQNRIGFTKLDKAKDNLGRMMRLKIIKNPFKKESLRFGLSFIKQFMLKRILIQNLCPILLKQKLIENNFVFVNENMIYLIKNILSNLRKNKRRITLIKKVNNLMDFSYTDSSVLRNQLSKSVLCENSDILIKNDIQLEFHAEIIKNDESIFGNLKITENSLCFESLPKDSSNNSYRLGPSIEMHKKLEKQFSANYEFIDILEIKARRYNLIWQAIEIKLRNHVSIFIVLFSDKSLSSFFTSLSKFSNSSLVEIMPCPSIKVPEYTKKWLSSSISNFKYLLILNDFASRTFTDISQYPIFPWILQSDNNFRDLKYPIAGITSMKQENAQNKYIMRADLPGGPYQFGNHYMPGRAALGYLLRMQPYAQMIYKFDNGEDSPSRKFDSYENRWNSACTEQDNNFELIPEFFYNSEIFINRNCMSLGTKLIENEEQRFYGQRVRVDGVILPSWANNAFHFVQLNYLALENIQVRSLLHLWIDLIFGKNQQKAEFFNLFNPLTSEVFFIFH